MVLELFFIPGVGAAGVFSVLSMAAGVSLAYLKLGPLAGNIALVCVLVLLVVAIWLFLSGRTLQKLSLKTEISSTLDRVADLHIQIGDTAVASSRLAPMGMVTLQSGDEVEAESIDGFIDPKTTVEIVRINGNTVIVRRKE